MNPSEFLMRLPAQMRELMKSADAPIGPPSSMVIRYLKKVKDMGIGTRPARPHARSKRIAESDAELI